MPARPEALELFEQHGGLDDDTVADYVHRRGPQDPGGHEVERILLLADEDGVARVRPAVEPHDEVRGFREVVDDLALAFVAKFATQDYGPGHPIARTAPRTNSCSYLPGDTSVPAIEGVWRDVEWD